MQSHLRRVLTCRVSIIDQDLGAWEEGKEEEEGLTASH